ncbi:MAG: hypothetical protein K9L17_09805 [Clostridiales bacterium]|nr:hypothetical protein [Clostridiales bacterium]MCF8022974.1 hypothetical protein [Clostridiales bacterium]
MENARALDERLRRIIKEISSSTGSEIKKDLFSELTSSMEKTYKEQAEIQAQNTLRTLRQVIKKV